MMFQEGELYEKHGKLLCKECMILIGGIWFSKFNRICPCCGADLPAGHPLNNIDKNNCDE